MSAEQLQSSVDHILLEAPGAGGEDSCEDDNQPSLRIGRVQLTLVVTLALAAMVSAALVGQPVVQPHARSGTVLANSISLAEQVVGTSSRCLSPARAELGSALILMACSESTANFAIVGATIRLAANPAACVTISPETGPRGNLVVLDTCVDAPSQQVASLCLDGETEGVARAFVRPQCDSEVVDVGSQPQVSDSAVPTLFCFMVVLPGTDEVVLTNNAIARGASIFACELSKVYNGWDTGRRIQTPDGSFDANVEVFHQAWANVFSDGLFRTVGWTVKVDPDAVCMPGRLLNRLQGINAAEPIYVLNTDRSFHFLGPIEVLSKAAVDKLEEAFQLGGCPVELDAGEDGWLKACLDQHYVGTRSDYHTLNPSCGLEQCHDQSYVAFHSYKTVDAYNQCLDAAR